ncbi:MAG: TIGR03984 family CRISPR-associated protein [Candidatus Syntrophosphaera sp.]|nr:TIGR03984 family CRISPR-associated protein [Candidatus Syntrophosphaera sp.]
MMEELPKIQELKCRIEYINKLESLEDINQYLEDKDYLVYIITLSGISFGEFRNYQFKLIEDITKLDRLEELRIFDKERELHIWRQSDGKGGSVLKGRLRIDNPIEEAAQCYYRDAKQLLFGTKREYLQNGFTFLKEDRGFGVIIPNSLLSELKDNPRLYLCTRNYLEEWDNGQLSYCDSRFISIEGVNND